MCLLFASSKYFWSESQHFQAYRTSGTEQVLESYLKTTLTIYNDLFLNLLQ